MNYTHCLRCNRLLKDPISIRRGYGPICYTKSKNKKLNAEDRIKQLESELKILKKKVDEIQKMPTKQMRYQSDIQSINSNKLPSISHIQLSKLCKTPKISIPILSGGWDINELYENDLFLKMKQLVEV